MEPKEEKYQLPNAGERKRNNSIAIDKSKIAKVLHATSDREKE